MSRNRIPVIKPIISFEDMNGYYIWYKDFWNGNVKSYKFIVDNCSKYSRDLWGKYTSEWYNMGKAHTPSDLYNAIGEFNSDNRSQCSQDN